MISNATLTGLLPERVRSAFPVLAEVTYLNVGTYGLMPESALNAFQAYQAEFERRGVASDGTFYRLTEEARQRIAALIGAQAEEIAFTRNATDGINLVLSGLDWRPGDEVITLNEEHEAMMHPLMYLSQTRGLKAVRLEASPDAQEMLARLDQALTASTRLVAMSLVSCETGTRLPASAISRWAAEHGLLSLFDGAQASGAFPVKVDLLGCDFYASNGHKWLSEPKGTGFFYGRKHRLPVLSPAHVGAGSLQRVDIPNGQAGLFATGQRFEFGTRAWALTAGLNASLDWFESLGWEAVYTHIATLSAYAKQRILAQPGLALLSPQPFEQSSGLVSFVVRDRQVGEVSTALREKYKIYVRVVPHYNAIRIATAHFNTPADIDQMLDALDAICQHG